MCLERYENFMGAKINSIKSIGLQLAAWKGIVFPGPFSYKDEPVRIL